MDKEVEHETERERKRLQKEFGERSNLYEALHEDNTLNELKEVYLAYRQKKN